MELEHFRQLTAINVNSSSCEMDQRCKRWSKVTTREQGLCVIRPFVGFKECSGVGRSHEIDFHFLPK